MKQLAIVSGKGGTGKTTIVAAFASLADRSVLADCDVDAADLHLILRPGVRQTQAFTGGLTASVDPTICVQCNVCRDLCRFDAIDESFTVDQFACEGCGVCHDHCPARAISLYREIAGEWFVSDTRFGPLVHAHLGIAQENSGKLVAQVRNEARRIAERDGLETIIIDGSPGIGCPVISSLTGVDLALAITEPTPSGLHDLDRLLDLTAHFNVTTAVCVNKADLSGEMTRKIAENAIQKGAYYLGEIPYDTGAVAAMIAEQTVIENQGNGLAEPVRRIWDKTIAILAGEA